MPYTVSCTVFIVKWFFCVLVGLWRGAAGRARGPHGKRPLQDETHQSKDWPLMAASYWRVKETRIGPAPKIPRRNWAKRPEMFWARKDTFSFSATVNSEACL